MKESAENILLGVVMPGREEIYEGEEKEMVSPAPSSYLTSLV
jgi:hypothetical protein